MTEHESYIQKILKVRTNPGAIQSQALDRLIEIYNIAKQTPEQLDFVNSTNPVVNVLECSAFNTAASMIQYEAEARKIFPTLAINTDEIYNHMSDRDYMNRFASPARTSISFLFHLSEIQARAVATGQNNIRKMTIPRNTQISMNGITFTMQYPIDIAIMSHGGLQVVYDTSIASPLQTLSSNIVDWTIIKLEREDFLRINVPMQQLKIESYTAKPTLAAEFSQTFDIEDSFYYARVWHRRDSQEWEELKTTHSDQVFDPFVATALLKVVGKKVTVTIPTVYATSRMVTGTLRIDIYTTRGPLDLMLAQYEANNFTAEWRDLMVDKTDAFQLGVINFTSKSIYSTESVVGGSAELTFDQLRERVILNAMGTPNLPISNIQLGVYLSNLGYDAVKDLDYITRRDFLATRELPPPTDRTTVSGVGCSINRIAITMTELAKFSTTADNGDRITILPSTLYASDNGLTTILPGNIAYEIGALSPELKTRRINDGSFHYSPFHYVLDQTNNQFDHRGYYLDSPEILSKSFVAENDAAEILVTVEQYEIVRTDLGYRIDIVTRSSERWKEFRDSQTHVQMSFIPYGERTRAHINGELIGKTVNDERIYSFLIETNYDIDSLHNLVLTSFSMFDNPERRHAAKLLEDFDVIFAVSGMDLANTTGSAIDRELNYSMLPRNTLGITHERLQVRLGYALTGLWSNSRTVVTEEDYERYSENVPATYEQTVYERDPLTGAIKLESDGNGGVLYVVRHQKGDPVLDEDGQPVYKHFAGDVILDVNQRPVVRESRQLLRQVDILMFDGLYYFANSPSSIYQATLAPQTIVRWLENDIIPVSEKLLEQTDLFFYPKITMGAIEAIVGDEREVRINAQQAFEVVYYLKGPAYRDLELRGALTRMAVETIDESLRKSVVAMNEISTKLSNKAGSDVVALTVTGLGGSNDPQAVVTLKDAAARLSILKKAIVLPDNTIDIQDAVEVSFVQHTI